MPLDTQIFYFLNNLAGQSPLFDRFVVFLASTFSYVVMLAFIVLLVFSVYSNREKVVIFLTAFAAAIVARLGVTELIRHYYHRPRPFTTLTVHQLLTDPAWSFPSGHAAFFFALATAIFLFNRRWGIIFFACAVLITVSRVIVGVHYPSDILGGATIGALVGLAVFKIGQFLAQKASNTTY